MNDIGSVGKLSAGMRRRVSTFIVAPLVSFAVLAASFVAFAAPAHAVPISYMEQVYGGNASGSLGAVSFTNAVFVLTFDGDTNDVVPFSIPGASGYEIVAGTAAIQIFDAASRALLAQATFLPSAGIYVSVDNANNGIGFGSHGALPTAAGFPGEPVYPSGLLAPTGAVTSYDLKSPFDVLGFAISCVGFGGPTGCNAPYALPTDAGDLVLDHVNISSAEFTSFLPNPVTTFSQFDVRPELRSRELNVRGRFALGSGSDGINPTAEAVTLDVGGFSVAIPPGSFRATRDGRFVFKGTIGGAKLELQIAPTGASGGYQFTASAQRRDRPGHGQSRDDHAHDRERQRRRDHQEGPSLRPKPLSASIGGLQHRRHVAHDDVRSTVRLVVRAAYRYSLQPARGQR